MYSNTTVKKENFWLHQILVVFFDLCQKGKRLEKRYTFLILAIFCGIFARKPFFNELFCVKITDFFSFGSNPNRTNYKSHHFFLCLFHVNIMNFCVCPSNTVALISRLNILHCPNNLIKYALKLHNNFIFELHKFIISTVDIVFSNYKANKIFTFNLSTSIRNQ